jgi:hypothetical protein
MLFPKFNNLLSAFSSVNAIALEGILSIYAQLTRNTWLKIIVSSVHLYYILAAILALSFNHS